MKHPQTKWVDIDDIKLGPILNPVLPAQLIVRIKRYCEILFKDFPISLEEHLKNYQRNIHPEKEIVLFETMAKVYNDYTTEYQPLNLDQKKELLTILLDGSAASTRPEGFKNFDLTEVSAITKSLEKVYYTMRTRDQIKRNGLLVYAEFFKGVFLVALIASLITTVMVLSECKSDICYVDQGPYEPIIMSFRQRLITELMTWPLIASMGIGILVGVILADRKSEKLKSQMLGGNIYS